MQQQPQAYSVYAITRMIKDTLASSFHDIWVEGEISNYLHHTSGHRYFNLKDDKAVLKITLWRSVGSSLKFEPQNGGKVLAYGDISVYEKAGQYQLNCRKLIPVGIGEFELAFRQLHERLAAEGLFAPDLKKPIPRFSTRIGVVTSPTGAAIRDIINVARRRNDTVQLIIYPAQVQGSGAAETIAAGIEYLNTRDDIDLIITGRGGGSLEDIWPFNEEITVRAIVASRIPVISAVGHEVDTTLSDLAGDLRAPTPSAAAEIAIWSRREFEDLINGHVNREAMLLGHRLKSARSELKGLISRPVFSRPQELTGQRRQYLDNLVLRMITSGKTVFERRGQRLSSTLARLDALSPLKVLQRGYSVSRKVPSGKVLKSAADLLPGDRMETLLARGRVVSFVEEVAEKHRHDGKKEV